MLSCRSANAVRLLSPWPPIGTASAGARAASLSSVLAAAAAAAALVQAATNRSAAAQGASRSVEVPFFAPGVAAVKALGAE